MELAFFAACAPGLEPLLAIEVEAIAPGALAVPGGVEARGDRRTLARLLVELGLASHVLVRVASFRVRDLDGLESHVARLPWSGWVTRGVPRRVRATSSKSRLSHTGAIEERIARAITTRLGDGGAGGDTGAPTGDEAGAPPAAAPIPIVARVVGDRCMISLDASGDPLHRRGYRLDPHRAPLREDLARALVIASGWDRTSLLVDPMCGSGTIPIEAALLAGDRAPGLARSFAMERTPLDDGVALAQVRAEARARAHPTPGPIVGRDRDARAIQAARTNAERAGVEILLEVGPLSTTITSIPTERGAAPRVVTNPPWGERLGDPDALRALYRALGQLRRALGRTARLTLAAHDRKLAYATAVPMASAFMSDLGGLKVHAMTEQDRA